MEVRVSGFRVEGSWQTVVRHAHRLSKTLLSALIDRNDEISAADRQAFGQWEEWRPRAGDELDQVADRTAEQASVGEGEGETQDVGVREDLAEAGRKLDEATEDLAEDGVSEAAESVGESAEHTARAADTASRRVLRVLEENLYRHVVTRLSPYYFHNRLVGANLERVGDDEYVFEVQVNDDALKDAVADRLEAMIEEEGE